MNYYKTDDKGNIMMFSSSEENARAFGLDKTTEREIVMGCDLKLHFKGDEPQPPPVPKKYSIPDLFFWLRVYDEAHPDAKKGQAVVDFLNGQNLYTIAVTTRVVSEENKLFVPTIAAIKKAVGFTDKEVEEALTYAETNAAPDAAE